MIGELVQAAELSKTKRPAACTASGALLVAPAVAAQQNSKGYLNNTASKSEYDWHQSSRDR
jgi:hypothetical protein